MKKIVFQPQALHIGSNGYEILAGAELSTDDVQALVKVAHERDPFTGVFLIYNGGHRQRLSFDQLEIVLSEPLAEYRAKLAQEAAERAEAIEKAAQEAEAQRAAQEAAERAEAQAEEAAKKSIFADAIG